MTTTVEELTVRAITLPPEDRAHLADLLFASLPEEAGDEVDAQRDAEIKRRVGLARSGGARTAPAVDVHAEVRRILQT
jgi:hypothetical protein